MLEHSCLKKKKHKKRHKYFASIFHIIWSQILHQWDQQRGGEDIIIPHVWMSILLTGVNHVGIYPVTRAQMHRSNLDIVSSMSWLSSWLEHCVQHYISISSFYLSLPNWHQGWPWKMHICRLQSDLETNTFLVEICTRPILCFIYSIIYIYWSRDCIEGQLYDAVKLFTWNAILFHAQK